MDQRIRRRLIVTKTAIKRGIRKNPWECPVARACHKVGWRDCYVGSFTITVEAQRRCDNFPQIIQTKLPGKVVKFIGRYDAGLPVRPFSCWITLRLDD